MKLGILIIIAAMLLCLLYTANWLLSPVSSKSIEAHVKVDEYVGINLDTDKLYFGTVRPGGWSQRSTTIEADNFGVVSITGEASSWIEPSERTFLAQGTREIVFSIHVPENTTPGNYTAQIHFHLYRPLARLLV